MKQIALIILSIFLLSSCSGEGKNSVILKEEIKTNQTMIFVKRETGFSGSGAIMSVDINNINIAKLGNGESSSTTVVPGNGILSVKWTGMATIGAEPVYEPFRIKKGSKLYYLFVLDDNKLRIFKVNQYRFFNNREHSKQKRSEYGSMFIEALIRGVLLGL